MSAPACQPLVLEACLQFVAAKVLLLANELSKLPGDKCLAVDHFVDEFVEEKDFVLRSAMLVLTSTNSSTLS